MNISDGELGLASAFGRGMVQTTSHAQAIIDRKNRELGAALRKIAALEAELASLRGDRVARNRSLLLESLSQH